MCLYPKLILNRRYLPSKKNGGVTPVCPDERLRYVTAECGDCYECRRQKQRQWQVRMQEELRENPNAYFMTLTIDDKSYKELKKAAEDKTDNGIATIAMRRMLERIRKKTGKSIRHWFVTELGQEKTERVHLHGIIWGIGADKLVEEKWNYGIIFTGFWVNEQTVNYITKYMLKVDEKHPMFRGKVLCSAGLGSGYTKRADSKNNRYQKGKTNETYKFRNGVKVNLPIYYRNKLYSEEEREMLFLDKLDKGIIWVMGQPVKADDYKNYEALLREARDYTGKLLFDKPKDWEQRKYINRLKRQRNYYENKEPKIVEKLKRKETKAKQRLDKDLDMFANLRINSL